MAVDVSPEVLTFDVAGAGVRELNRTLHALAGSIAPPRVVIANPGGRHSIAVGLDAPFEVEIDGHVGYYCAGMNQQATVRVRGNCGVGVAENMMSGSVLVAGSASQEPRERHPRAAVCSRSAGMLRHGAGSR